MKTDEAKRLERAARAADVISRAQAASPITNASVDRLDDLATVTPALRPGGRLLTGSDIL